MSTAAAIAALAEASKELLYQSESDEPFTTFNWKKADGALTADKVLKRAGKRANSPVAEVTLKDFFADPTTEEDWHGDEEKAIVEQYRKLLEVIQQNLSEVKVFKVGARKVSIFIAGKTDEGDWAGLKTIAVET
jgi:Nuclease A inhibitor-like protein